MYYISVSHWGLIPVPYSVAMSMFIRGEACLVDDYLLIPFERN